MFISVLGRSASVGGAESKARRLRRAPLTQLTSWLTTHDSPFINLSPRLVYSIGNFVIRVVVYSYVYMFEIYLFTKMVYTTYLEFIPQFSFVQFFSSPMKKHIKDLPFLNITIYKTQILE